MSLVYNTKVVRDGLVLHLDAANVKSYPGSGTVVTDLSNNNNNGTLTNGTTHSSTNGGLFDFDGTNDYIAVSNIGFSGHTIEGWVKMHQSVTGTSGSDLQSAVGSYTVTGDGKYTYIGPYGTNTMTFRVDDGVSSHQLIGQFTSVINQWYHVAITYDSTNGNCIAYKDGESFATRSFTSGIVFDNTPLDIARSQNNTTLDGQISAVKMYNRPLTAAEIRQNFEALRGRYGI